MKNPSKPAYERLIKIHQLILMKRYPNTRVLAAECGVDRRTIARDIEFLKDRCEAPIEYSAEHNGYFYERPFDLPALQFLSEGEFFSLCVAEKAAEIYRNTPFEGELTRVFDKIKSMLPNEISMKTEYTGAHFSIVPDTMAVVSRDVWETLSRAAIHRRQTKIVHRRAGSDERKERVFDCYHLFGYKGGWFAIGFCHLRKEIRTFSLSRIDNIELLDSEFTVARNFDLTKELHGNFGIATGREKYRVKIIFSPRVASQIRERIWHPAQKISVRNDGCAVLTFPARSFVEILPWVLSWGGDAEVIAPDELRQMAAEEARRTAAMYV